MSELHIPNDLRPTYDFLLERAAEDGEWDEEDLITKNYIERIARLEADLAAANATIERLSAPVSGWAWQCNECGSDEFTDCVSEDDIAEMTCTSCGSNEFHKVAARAKEKP